MFPRFSISSLILAVLVICILVFNLLILTSLGKENQIVSHTAGATYYTGGKHALKAHVDKVDSPEFIAAVVKELEETKKEELLDELKAQVSKDEKPAIIQNLKTEMRTKYLDVLKDTLKEEIKEENTNEIFKQSALSYELFEKLANDYAKTHEKEFQPAAFLSILKELQIDQFPKEFELQVERATKNFFDRKKYFNYLLKDILLENTPKCEAFTDEEKGKKLNPTYQWDARIISEKYLRESNLKMSGDKFKCLKESHEKVVSKLKTLATPPSKFVNGRGIVINGAGGMLVGALTVISNLRDRGSTLPVELVLDRATEYDKQICDELLPKTLNGRCVVVENEVGTEVFNAISEKFSRKILGILVSSFDDTIAIDADNFPIADIDNLITTEPYLSTKMILWPDLWVKLTSPLYYKIAGIEKGEIIHRYGLKNEDKFEEYIQKDKQSEVHYHDFENLPNPISVETGQLVFSKSEHMRSLLLALYYNINMKKWYETLLYQGAFGEGDRETIVPALHVMNERYHLMNQKVHILDYEGVEGKGGSTSGLGQTDPRDNPQFYADWKLFLSSKNMDQRLNPFQSGDFTRRLVEQFKNYKQKLIEDKQIDDEATAHRLVEYKFPGLLFLHCNQPKINPIKNSKEGQYGAYSRRSLGKKEKVKSLFVKDWELKFHSIAKWVVCEAVTSADFWQNEKANQKHVCERVTKYVEFLKEDSWNLESEFKGFDIEKSKVGSSEKEAEENIKAIEKQQEEDKKLDSEQGAGAAAEAGTAAGAGAEDEKKNQEPDHPVQ